VVDIVEKTLADSQILFEAREAARRRTRIARLDALADARLRIENRHPYYSDNLRRLVASFTVREARVLEVGCGLGDLLAALPARERVGVDISPRMIELGRTRHPTLDLRIADIERDPIEGQFDTVVLSDAIGLLDDIQLALERIRSLLAPGGRLVVTYYNFLWEPVLRVAEALGLKMRWPDQSWLSMSDLENLLHITGFEVVRRGTDVLVPARLLGLEVFVNKVASKLPGLKELALVDYFVARPLPLHSDPDPSPSVSVVCPCRNERGNIRAAVDRTPLMGRSTELIFVDGNSTDGTVKEIEDVMRHYTGALKIKYVPQGRGTGKGDAVRKGFAAAENDILMILDADLTVPPEDLSKFYRTIVTHRGEFINGVRLVYPMEGEAMRFLNLLGNKFFSTALSWMLEQPIKDSLCGTKVLHRKHYQAIAANRQHFGDFDPFGDFDLLFGAARLNLRIVDLPVRYRARTYGDTKISRFSHGWLLAKMTMFGLKKLRLGD
jgi:SAM-dependent methyltransferase